MKSEPFITESSDTADWTTVAALQKRMAESVEAIGRMTADVGLARHIREYDGDRLKRALARAMAAPLAGGSSAAKAEAEARSGAIYNKEFEQLSKEHAQAEQIMSEYECKKLEWETARSLLSFQRETVKTL